MNLYRGYCIDYSEFVRHYIIYRNDGAGYRSPPLKIADSEQEAFDWIDTQTNGE